MAFTSDVHGTGKRLGGLARNTAGAIRSYMNTSIHRTGAQWAKEVYGLARRDSHGRPIGKLWRGLGLAYLGYQAYQGYQEGGIPGAAKEVAYGAAETYALGAGIKALGIGAGWGAGLLGGAAVFGGFFFGMESARQGINPFQMAVRPFVQEHMKKHAILEMGSPINDQFGTLATMRQRSLMAMQQSKITARGALGMESSRRYIPYMR
jgi:hypothetical protein